MCDISSIQKEKAHCAGDIKTKTICRGDARSTLILNKTIKTARSENISNYSGVYQHQICPPHQGL